MFEVSYSVSARILPSHLKKSREHIEAAIERIKYDGQAFLLHHGRDALDKALAREPDKNGDLKVRSEEIDDIANALGTAHYMIRDNRGGFAEESRGARYSDGDLQQLKFEEQYFEEHRKYLQRLKDRWTHGVAIAKNLIIMSLLILVGVLIAGKWG